ncbi:probable RNA-directed DNA polymerase from transposon BS [Caerostris darwini]|uniref:Probable RNA-directed DNA polymerase from transposon BS n=1 Tax=Caerostris darwini TaxID=1538125 RepID=A0AAV4UAI8_9ARAC|nr:probable RNA-directed DNA polymerase from transposon BS [Caerostris darwini]
MGQDSSIRQFEMVTVVTNRRTEPHIIHDRPGTLGANSSTNFKDSTINLLLFDKDQIGFKGNYAAEVAEILQPNEDTTRSFAKKFRGFTEQEIGSVISNIKPNKSPGPDSIPGELVKEMYYANKVWFMALLNRLLEDGVFPKEWKRANVVFIPKENKDLSVAAHYRPICLLSSWGKIFDKLISNRITYYLEVNDFFNPRQYGFRKRKSTISAIQNIKSFVEQAALDKKMVCLISLDIKYAFNSVNWSLLRNKIANLRIPHYLICIILDFLKDRSASYDNLRISYNQGIPQGSCLGLILWNIYINDLLNLEFGDDVLIQAFVDDIVLMIKERVSYLFKDRSQEPLGKIYNWTQASDNGQESITCQQRFKFFKFYRLLNYIPSVPYLQVVPARATCNPIARLKRQKKSVWVKLLFSAGEVRHGRLTDLRG